MNVTDKTKAVAQAVLDYHALTEHKLHDQGSWVAANVADDFTIDTKNVGGVDINICSTSMCAAGTAVFVTRSPKEFTQFFRDAENLDAPWSEEGKNLLGLNGIEANTLFYEVSDEDARTILAGIAKGNTEIFEEYDED